MTFEEDLSNSLKHVRFVHFSLLVICATALYFVFTSWSSAPELVAELLDYGRYAEQAESNPEAIFDLNRKWLRLQISTLSMEFSEWIDRDVLNQADVERWIRTGTLKTYSTNLKFDTNIDSLGILRKKLDQLEWSISTMGEVSRVPGLQEWFQDQRTRSEQFDDFEIHLDRFFRIVESPTDAAVTVEVRFVARFASDGDGPWSVRPENFSLTYIPHTAQVQMAEGWFEADYSIINKYWNHIEHRTLQSALTWAAEERTRHLKDEKLVLLGTQVRVQHIGYVGPTAIICVLLYLMVHVRHIEIRIAVQSASDNVGLFFIPWVGGMSGSVPKFVTGTSFLVVPPLSVVLLVWRLSNEPTLALVLSSTSLFLGWRTFRSSRAINCDQAE